MRDHYYIIQISRIQGSKFEDSFLKTAYEHYFHFTSNPLSAKKYVNFQTAVKVAEKLKERVDFDAGEIKDILVTKVEFKLESILAI